MAIHTPVALSAVKAHTQIIGRRITQSRPTDISHRVFRHATSLEESVVMPRTFP